MDISGVTDVGKYIVPEEIEYSLKELNAQVSRIINHSGKSSVDIL